MLLSPLLLTCKLCKFFGFSVISFKKNLSTEIQEDLIEKKIKKNL